MSIMKRIRHILTPIITGLMWLLVILIATLTINFVFGRDENVALISFISTALMVITNLLWSPTGIELGEKVAKVHNNTIIYMNRANYIVDNQMFEQAKEFCDYRNEEYKKELIARRLAKVLISVEEWTTFDELYRKTQQKKVSQKDRTEFEQLVDKYNDKQLKVMTRLSEKGVWFSPLVPDDLIKYHDTKNRLKPRNGERMSRTIRIVIKIIWGITLGLFTVGLIVSAQSFGLEQILQILAWTISILVNIYTSISNSYRSVTVYRNNYLVEKNDRCAEFFAYWNIKTKDIDQNIADKLIKDNEK